MKRSQEYIKNLSPEKKKEVEILLQKEGGKSKFRSKIQMTWIYIFASALVLVALLVTNYLLADANKAYYVPLIVCFIVALVLYLFYFWKWFKDYKAIKEYVQSHWFKLYIWVLILTAASFLICFLCTLIPVVQGQNAAEGFLGGSLPIYYALLVGIIVDILCSLIAASMDAYVIYHLEVDLQRLLAEYEENQVDYLKEKIKFEANKFNEYNNETKINTSEEEINQKKQVVLTQEEIDNLLKENSLLGQTDTEEKEKTDENESNNEERRK